MYRDVIQMAGGTGDRFEVLPTPLVIADVSCAREQIVGYFIHSDECLEILSQEARKELMMLAPVFANIYIYRLQSAQKIAEILGEVGSPSPMQVQVVEKFIDDLTDLYDFETSILSDQRSLFMNQNGLAMLELLKTLLEMAGFSDDLSIQIKLQVQKEEILSFLQKKLEIIKEELGEQKFSDLLTLETQDRGNLLEEKKTITLLYKTFSELQP